MSNYIKQAKAFVVGCMFTVMVCSVCLNVYMYQHNREIGYTEIQREQMDQLAQAVGE